MASNQTTRAAFLIETSTPVNTGHTWRQSHHMVLSGR